MPCIPVKGPGRETQLAVLKELVQVLGQLGHVQKMPR